jgi:hypothetical protein
LVPAGSPVWARSSGHKDELHIFLDARVVARVAAEAFDLDPARLTVPPLDGLDLPYLRAAMGAVDAELTALAAESSWGGTNPAKAHPTTSTSARKRYSSSSRAPMS